MGIPQYLAMTEPELLKNSPPPFLACLGIHFSQEGLSNLPQALPKGAVLILDDRTPLESQSIPEISETLCRFLARCSCRGLLLDFQRPGILSQKELAAFLSRDLPCPVAAPPEYAPEGCPVFLPPVPVDCAVETHLAPWQGREIWLDTSLQGLRLTLTKAGTTCAPTNAPVSQGFYDDDLCCQYTIRETAQGFLFHLYRDRASLQKLLARAEPLGVTMALGLWQEFGPPEGLCENT